MTAVRVLKNGAKNVCVVDAEALTYKVECWGGNRDAAARNLTGGKEGREKGKKAKCRRLGKAGRRDQKKVVDKPKLGTGAIW